MKLTIKIYYFVNLQNATVIMVKTVLIHVAIAGTAQLVTDLLALAQMDVSKVGSAVCVINVRLFCLVFNQLNKRYVY